MTGQTSPFRVQRILVPVDTSEHSLAALSLAAELAAALGAEVEGLFVEDIHLLQLSDYPFAREVSLFGTTFRRIDRTETERQLRIQAARLQGILADEAGRLNVPWTFKVTRGGVPAEVLAAAEKADLTILGRFGRSVFQEGRVGSTVRTILAQGSGLTLILQQGMYFQPPVQVVFTGSELSEKALTVALDLGERKELPLLVILIGDEQRRLDRFRERVKAEASGHRIRVTITSLPADGFARVCAAVRNHGPGLLVIPCEEPYFQGKNLRELIAFLPNPVLLVRTG